MAIYLSRPPMEISPRRLPIRLVIRHLHRPCRCILLIIIPLIIIPICWRILAQHVSMKAMPKDRTWPPHHRIDLSRQVRRFCCFFSLAVGLVHPQLYSNDQW